MDKQILFIFFQYIIMKINNIVFLDESPNLSIKTKWKLEIIEKPPKRSDIRLDLFW